MAIDNQFRIDELISKGSRAIISKDSETGTHTFVTNSKQIVDDPYPHIKGDRDGEQVGTIEKPKYNEEQLVKAVDTVVDELIGPPKKEQPPVVPKPLYDDLRRLYDLRGVRINELETQVSNLESIISQLEAQIESLQIELDAARLQQTVAENQSQQINEQYVALLQDFSTAVIKSTKEGIERVSLKAQTEGLIAQKESLRNQIQALNNIIKALQGQIEVQQAQIEAEQVRQASSEALEGVANTFDQRKDTGFKIKQSEIKKQDKQLYIEVFQRNNKNDIRVVQGTAINVYNFNEEESQTFTASSNVPWLKIGGPVTVPPRDGSSAGKGYLGIQWSNAGRTNKRKQEIPGTVTITASPSGEQFSISAIYFKEAQRADDDFKVGSTQSGLGER